jgi:hypothetical protein
VLIPHVRALLAELLPPRAVAERGGGEDVLFSLPIHPDADYGFSVRVEPEEAELTATRRAAPTGEYFWHHPFEDAAYDSVTSLRDALLAELRTVLTRPTRVTMRRGWITWGFTCEARAPAGAWERVYAHGVLRGNAGLPPHAGRETTWHAPAVGAAGAP